MVTKHYAFWYGFLFFLILLPLALSIVTTGRAQPLMIAVFVAVAVVLPPVVIWIAQKLGYPIGRAVHCSRCSTE